MFLSRLYVWDSQEVTSLATSSGSSQDLQEDNPSSGDDMNEVGNPAMRLSLASSSQFNASVSMTTPKKVSGFL